MPMPDINSCHYRTRGQDARTIMYNLSSCHYRTRGQDVRTIMYNLSSCHYRTRGQDVRTITTNPLAITGQGDKMSGQLQLILLPLQDKVLGQ
jgi:hypothetical protein